MRFCFSLRAVPERDMEDILVVHLTPFQKYAEILFHFLCRVAWKPAILFQLPSSS
eukprot:m.354805 g.354805  ORF g.354805 m.354805 type:complete len:55 (+) comp20725_c0_seq2:279-443(+)